MKQVYMNILMNAYQATDSGGSIRVSTHYDQARDGILTVFSDTGCGIPRVSDRVFEPFFTTKNQDKGQAWVLPYATESSRSIMVRSL